MKSYEIISNTGRDPTCDEDSDLEAQLWLQFPSRNSIHQSPAWSMAGKHHVHLQGEKSKSKTMKARITKAFSNGIKVAIKKISITNIDKHHHKDNICHIQTVYPPVPGPTKVPCEPRSFLRRSKFSTKSRPSISCQSEAATS